MKKEQLPSFVTFSNFKYLIAPSINTAPGSYNISIELSDSFGKKSQVYELEIIVKRYFYNSVFNNKNAKIINATIKISKVTRTSLALINFYADERAD